MAPKLKSRWSKMIKEIDLQDLTNTDDIRQLIDHLKSSQDQYILKENGEPLAALLSLEDFELLQKANIDKEAAWQDLFENLNEVHSLNPDVSEKEVHADVAAAIRAIRRKKR